MEICFFDGDDGENKDVIVGVLSLTNDEYINANRQEIATLISLSF